MIYMMFYIEKEDFYNVFLGEEGFKDSDGNDNWNEDEDKKKSEIVGNF